MLYEIEQAVFERFPGYARMAVVAEGVDNTREIPELAELLAQCEEGVRRDDLEDFWHVPVLETWAEAFSGMGIKPKKNPPSVINLVKRCRAGKPLPFINPLVAIFNCISLKYLLPCGGDDLNVIEGDLRLGIADGTENYVPLGQPDMLEHPQPGEVIYYDTATKDVFCRAWCWKNGNRSKLMPETTNAVINVDAMPPLPLATAEQAAEELKLTADDALALGVVESVIPEAGLGEPEFYDALAQRLMREVDALTEMPIQELLSARYARFRRFGGEAQA